ncbi:porin [Candidatus Methylocalor cossyra]|uniref:Beta-barrel porin-2, OmpL-like. bbp2 n=1 Tax=Candidatus Methylocalor cossyra TaxID=3108543 RepID=A0ABM9NLG2_9GAMM
MKQATTGLGLRAVTAGILSALVAGPVHGGEAAEATGLADYMAGKGDAQPLKDFGIKWGGWLNSSISTNFNSSPDKFNGPVTFGDRSAELQLNQAYVWLQKAVEVSGERWDFGARFDFLYGTDAIFTQAYGVPATDPKTGQLLNRGNWDLHLTSFNNRFYGIALPQAYAEVNVPVGNGLGVKIGHFYTPVGYEVVTAPDNFFFSKPYTFQYGEPFTHTGVLGSYSINDNWSVLAGAVTGSATGGWDGNWNTQLSNWDFLGGASWTSDDKNYSLALTSTAGSRSAQHSDAWAIYSLVGKANFLDNTLHYIIQHDHGFADNVMTANSLKQGPGVTGNARWYGINQYLMYDLRDDLTVGLRAEWFRDNDGFRVNGPGRCGAGLNANAEGVVNSYTCPGYSYPFAGSSYYEITAGLVYKPIKWIMIRPNLRYDWTDKVKAFDAGKRKDQLLFSTDIVITF